MQTRRNRIRRLLAGLSVAAVHLLIVWMLMPTVTASLVEPESFPPSIDVWLGPNPGGSRQAVSPAVPAPLARREATKMPIETRKPPPLAHPDPIPPKAEPQRAPSSATVADKPDPSATPSMAAGTANWSGRGLGQGFGRGPGQNLAGGGAGGASDNRGKGPRTYVWARELTLAERQASYPTAGRYAPGGLVVLSCVLRGEDRLGGCLILTEQPAGHGFGAAAINTSQLRGVRPANPEDRLGPGERVTIEMRFIRVEAGG